MDLERLNFMNEERPKQKPVVERLTDAVHAYLDSNPSTARELTFELSEADYTEFLKGVSVYSRVGHKPEQEWDVRPTTFLGPQGVRVTINVKKDGE
jgi:hypothetical protein